MKGAGGTMTVPLPTGYAVFAGFVVRTMLATMCLITFAIFAFPVVSGEAGPREFGMALAGALQLLPVFVAFLIPVLIVGLSVGYGVWRIVLATSLGCIPAAIAVSGLGSATLAAIAAWFLAPVELMKGNGEGAFIRLFLTSFLMVFAVAAPVAAFMAWRWFVRIV